MKLRFIIYTLILSLVLSACGNVAGVSTTGKDATGAAISASELSPAETDIESAKPDAALSDPASEGITDTDESTEPTGTDTEAGSDAEQGSEQAPGPVLYEPAAPGSDGNATGIVYLTFDDGPCGYTDDVLAVLDKYGIKASFFLTGSHPSMFKYIKDIADGGHGIGVHSYSHEYYQCYASEQAFYDECEKMNDVIEEYTGCRTDILRFPGGSSNTVSAKYVKGLMTALAAGVADRGYSYFDWNVSSGDTGSNATVDSIIANVKKGIKKHKESVVLMHDFKKNTLTALPYIIEWGLENGYEFRPLTSSAPGCHQKINN